MVLGILRMIATSGFVTALMIIIINVNLYSVLS